MILTVFKTLFNSAYFPTKKSPTKVTSLSHLILNQCITKNEYKETNNCSKQDIINTLSEITVFLYS